MSRKNSKKEKVEALKSLDEQIVLSRDYAKKVLETKGIASSEYATAMVNLKTLTEARAEIANSNPKKLRVDPTAIVTGGFGLASTALLLIYDDEHVVPKWFHSGIDKLSVFLKPKQ